MSPKAGYKTTEYKVCLFSQALSAVALLFGMCTVNYWVVSGAIVVGWLAAQTYTESRIRVKESFLDSPNPIEIEEA